MKLSSETYNGLSSHLSSIVARLLPLCLLTVVICCQWQHCGQKSVKILLLNPTQPMDGPLIAYSHRVCWMLLLQCFREVWHHDTRGLLPYSAMSLKRVQIEEKLLWRAYSKWLPPYKLDTTGVLANFFLGEAEPKNFSTAPEKTAMLTCKNHFARLIPPSKY